MKRYDNENGVMTPQPDGEWVKYEEAKSLRPEAGVAMDTVRLDWLVKELPVTIAYGLDWDAIPQNGVSFRAALDKAMGFPPLPQKESP